LVGGRRRVSSRRIASGSLIHELDIHDFEHLRSSVLGRMIGVRSADKYVPEFVWRSGPAAKRTFLEALFTGAGSCSELPRNTVRISYSPRSARLAREVQQLLLEFGVISKRYRHATGEYKVAVTDRRDAGLF